MTHANTLLLPDSRLARKPDFGSKVVDWPLPGGKTVRIEAQLIFCANCGKEHGYVPLENTAFVCFLCNQCFEKFGAVTGTYAVPEEDFNRNVAAEMRARFGRDLTCEELGIEQEEGRLGTALEKLARESPYAVRHG